MWMVIVRLRNGDAPVMRRQSQVGSKNKLPKHMTAHGVKSISTQEPYSKTHYLSSGNIHEFLIYMYFGVLCIEYQDHEVR